MAEQVPAAPLQNQVQDVIDVALAPAVPAPEPVFAAPVAQVENRPPAAADNVAQNAPPEVTVPNVLIPSLFFSWLSTRVPFLSWFSYRCLLYLVVTVHFASVLMAVVVSVMLGFVLTFVAR